MARRGDERGGHGQSGRGRGGRSHGRGRGGRRAPSPTQSQDHQQRRKKQRGVGRQQHHSGGQSRHQQSPASTGPSAAFLSALEDQRENERRREALRQQQQIPAADDTYPPKEHISSQDALSAPTPAALRQQKPAVHIAGFYFDEAQRRYFKLTPQAAQRLTHEKKQREAREKDAAARRALQVRRAVQHSSSSSNRGIGARRSVLLRSAAGPSSTWVAYLAERESSCTWSAARRDTRVMAERAFASHMARSALRQVRAQGSTSRDRITALGFRAASGVGAMGVGGGRVDVFRVGYERDARFGFARQGERMVTVVEQLGAGASTQQVSALQWQPVDAFGSPSNLVLCACVGGEAPSSALTHEGAAGIVSLYRIRDRLESQRSAAGPSALQQQWFFRDPWSIEWSAADPGKFAVGLSGPECAAFVDSAVQSGVTRAPTGKSKTDVMAQAFTRDGRTIFNGTRSGTAWLWDLRARRRAQEQIMAASKRAQLSRGAAAILDLHVLSDDFQVVTLQSDGSLQLLDMRTFKTAVEFAPRRTDAYLPRLKCAVDESESVVVATASDESAVCSYSISSGRVVSRLAVDTSTLDSSMTPLEQVHLCEARDGSTEIWALGRNELFASARRADAVWD